MKSISPILIIFSIFLLYPPGSSAQVDTIRIVEYNLLNYGNVANPYSYKDPRLDTILQYIKPDIFGANEISSNAAHSQHILDTVLGPGWSKGSYINTNSQTQTNMLFWKNTLFDLVSETSVCNNLRDIIAYRLRFKDSITVPHDTVFITVIVGHLKAGQNNQDSIDRSLETLEVVAWLDSVGVEDNYIIMGDFNVYTSTEQCYQNLVASASPFSKFYDPINVPGDWNADISFASIHTQSTRDSALSDGGATGGLDDRFDQQLVSRYILGDSAGVKYIPNTYKALGQDGLHFNVSLIDPPINTSAPATVIQALYELSDHLPVYADYRFHAHPPVSIAGKTKTNYVTTVVNPLRNNELKIVFDQQLSGETMNIELCSIQGSRILSQKIPLTRSKLNASINVDGISTGIYYLRIHSASGYAYFSKIVNY
ncbi:MAG TPA: T9SS type A sorting domain-containing protein [Flavipsychrobacter sp.]|nr:T9SS type A sorting domain-containing protein [Flavipsychrobacter sp.]